MVGCFAYFSQNKLCTGHSIYPFPVDLLMSRTYNTKISVFTVIVHLELEFLPY